MRRLASVFNRFDGELLGLLLLSLGLLLLVSVLAGPASGAPVSPTGGLTGSAGHWLVGSLSWAAMLTPWPLIGLGALLLLSRPVGRVLRWSLGGTVVVLALLGLHDLWAPGAAGNLAAAAMTPLFAYLGYGAALPALLLLGLGLELMLAVAPLTLLRALARAALRGGRWAGGRALQFTDQARVGQTLARERAGVRRRLAAQQADLETLLGLLPGDERLQTLAAQAEGQRRALGSLSGDELARSAAETEGREAEVRRLTEEAAAVQAARLAARPELGSVLAMAARQLRAGRHPLAEALPLNAVSAALDEVRLALCGDLQRLQARAEELDRAQSRDLQALQKPSPALLSSVQRREGERAAAWQTLGERYRDWLVFERAYPGWPELAARYDAAPAGLAGALAGALQGRGRDLLPERGEWAAHLEQTPPGSGPAVPHAPATALRHPAPPPPGPAAPRPTQPTVQAGGKLRLPAPLEAVTPGRRGERFSVVAGSGRPLPVPAAVPSPTAAAPVPTVTPPVPTGRPAAAAAAPVTATVTQLRIVPTPVPLTLSPGRTVLASPEPAPVHRVAVGAAMGSAVPAASGAPHRHAAGAHRHAAGSHRHAAGSHPQSESAPAHGESAPLPGQLKVAEELPWEEPQPALAVAPAPRVRSQGAIDPVLPGFDLLSPVPETAAELALLDEEAQQRAALINETLSQFGLSARVIDFARGPTVTRYEIEPAPGEKISRIASLANDLARALAVGGVRIEAPVPGKSVIGLEVPNLQREPVTFHQAVASPAFQATRAKLPIILGKSIDGQMMVGDLAKMPHLLIAGSTGSGKSVCVNTLITSLLYRYLPSELRFLMIDPKMVELTPYDGIPHLVRGVVTNPSDAAGVLLGAVAHMERRYKMMSQVGAKNLEQYNAKMRVIHEPELPQLVLIIDELADLMITSPKEVESAIMRLAQMARATGMHLVLATQRPSVDILTSLIKVNVPARVAFAVSSSHDSRTILDSMGAERLTGQGDMLFYQPGLVKPMRLQGPYIGEEESVRITGFLQRQVFDDVFVETYGSDFDGPVMGEGSATNAQMDFSDPLLKQAALVCLEEGQGSVSRLQRRLSVGHARAGKLMDMLEAMGIVSKHQGSKPREVLIALDQLPEFFG